MTQKKLNTKAVKFCKWIIDYKYFCNMQHQLAKAGTSVGIISTGSRPQRTK